jgi:hypothetical protein
VNDELERMYKEAVVAYFEGTIPAFAAEVLTASIIRTYRPDDGGSKHLWNVGQFLRDYTAQQSRR